MKKLLLSTVAVATLMFTGCGNAPQPHKVECQRDGTAAPKWVCTGGSNFEGGIAALGIAPPQPDPDMQMEEAMASARDKLARRIEVKVKNMFKKFRATTGIGKDMTMDRAVEDVSKQLSHATLRGSKLINSWESPKGNLYVLVGMPDVQKIQQEVKQAAKTSLKNNQALWQKFLAKKADKELDEAIKEEFGGQ